ncbi:MAG TPA: 1-acyl-sn-glycerol-3-phosphate acyltransferase [Acidimicrobiia bacterium]|nr:1-acyl-sn-glycerol-3-phosphate acyltransferase [Acidimicrobiia bacterium]
MTWLAEKWLKLRGWRFVGDMPDLDQMVLIGAPHTTNWDFIVYLGAIRHWRISPRYIAKHTLFRWPFGAFFRRFGGIPVDRTRGGGLVGQVTAAFRESERMILVMAPEGTRSAAPYWKSGFVKIAADAGVPIVPVYINFPRKEVVVGSPIHFTGDEKQLMDELRVFFQAGVGKHPEGAGPVRLKEERSV